MAKISTYKNYVTDKTTAEVDKFKETGVLPVSGKYTANGEMETKSITLSDLTESDLPDTTGHNQGDVLTIGANGPDWSTPTSDLPDTTGHNQGDVLAIGANGPDWSAPSSGGGSGMTMGQTTTITESDITGGGEYDTHVDFNVTNNTYSIVEIPSGLTSIDAIKLYVDTADLPNFIFHFKINDTTQYEENGIAVEIYYRADSSSNYTQFDHYREAGYDGESERAPLIYGPNTGNGFTGDNIVTCIGRYFEIKSLHSHVPPSGSWNGIYC